MKLIAAYDLTYGGRFVAQGDEFECTQPDGEEMIKRGFKPATKPKKTKPAAGKGDK